VFPWNFTAPKKPETPREQLLEWLREGVPPEDACEALGMTWEQERHAPEIIQAAAHGRVQLFIRAKDSGVTGVIRAAMRVEAKTWQPKAEPNSGLTLEDYLRD